MSDVALTVCASDKLLTTAFLPRNLMYRQYETSGWFWILFIYATRPDGTIHVRDVINITVSHAQGGMQRPKKISLKAPDGLVFDDVFAHGHLVAEVTGLYTFSIETPGGDESIVVEVLPA